MKIGVILSSSETIFNLSFVPEFLVLGSADVTPTFYTKVSVSVGGKDYINLNGSDLIEAYMKRGMNANLATSKKLAIFEVSDGFIGNQSCQIKITNSGISSRDLYVFSTGEGYSVNTVGNVSINPLSNMGFENFKELILDPTNIDYAQVLFSDGHSEKMSVIELYALMGVFTTIEESDGNSNNLYIDNELGTYQSINFYTTNGGSQSVTVVR